MADSAPEGGVAAARKSAGQPKDVMFGDRVQWLPTVAPERHRDGGQGCGSQLITPAPGQPVYRSRIPVRYAVRKPATL